jgi:hypothetical protein
MHRPEYQSLTPNGHPITIEQIAAYAAAIYEVQVDKAWISVEQWPRAHSSALDRCVISACNPHSQRLSDAENKARHQHLQVLIEAAQLRWWPARGRSPDANWVEPGFLLEAPLSLVDHWARQYGQHAVWLPQGSEPKATMRIYAPFSESICPVEFANVRLEWVGFAPSIAD